MSAKYASIAMEDKQNIHVNANVNHMITVTLERSNLVAWRLKIW